MSDTTDDLTPDDGLASAYLDGEVTPDERARVEASPDLLEKVEALRQVRAVLGATTEPPPISVRESQLATALDVWDRMSDRERSGEVTPSRGMDAAAAAAITTPTPTSLSARRDRRRSGDTTKWLLGAAAGLVILAGAGLAVRNFDSGSDDESAGDVAEEAPAEEAADDSEAELVPEMAASEFAGDEVESAPAPVNADDVESEGGSEASADAGAAAEVAAADEPAREPAEEEAMEESAAEEPTDLASDPDDVSRPETDLAVLSSPEELADFAAFAAYAPVDAEAPQVDFEPPFNTCSDSFAPFTDIDQYTELALYQGQEVAIGIDRDTDPFTAIAYRPAECIVVDQVLLPTRDDFESREQP